MEKTQSYCYNCIVAQEKEFSDCLSIVFTPRTALWSVQRGGYFRDPEGVSKSGRRHQQTEQEVGRLLWRNRSAAIQQIQHDLFRCWEEKTRQVMERVDGLHRKGKDLYAGCP